MIGITSFGAHIPKLRLSRKSIADANAWGNAGLKGLAKGERAMCNWDEDSVTMAVAAARDCLRGQDASTLRGVYMATTTPPFLDRQNSGIVAAALHLDHDVSSMDVTASQKAGTSGLIAAMHVTQGMGEGNLMFVAADKRRAKASSPQEMQFGDGAAAVMLGSKNSITSGWATPVSPHTPASVSRSTSSFRPRALPMLRVTAGKMVGMTKWLMSSDFSLALPSALFTAGGTIFM